jgi:hypothetical protein
MMPPVFLPPASNHRSRTVAKSSSTSTQTLSRRARVGVRQRRRTVSATTRR